ncbi:MAG: DNA internalization-related competence protein ComEC/Rec2 [Bacteroidota bacterium]
MNTFKYPAVKVALMFTAGILLQHSFHFPLIATFLAVALVTATAGGLTFLWRRIVHESRETPHPVVFLTDILLLLGVAGAGAFIHGYNDYMRASHKLAHIVQQIAQAERFNYRGNWNSSIYRGVEVTSIGSALEPPHIKPAKVTFAFHIDSFRVKSSWEAVKGNVLAYIHLKNPSDSSLWIYAIRPGKIYQIHGMLSLPEPARNPGELDYAAYLKMRDIHALLHADADNIQLINKEMHEDPLHAAARATREWCTDVFNRFVGGEEGDFLRGLLLGDRSGVDPDVRSAFINAGVIHVLAVSGLHVGIIAAIVFALLDVFRLPRTPKALATMVTLTFYVILVGAPPSAVRAGIMTSAIVLGHAMERKTSSLNTIAAAALIILTIDTFSIFNVGFLLSFAAVIGIVTLYKPLRGIFGRHAVSGLAWIAPVFDLLAVSVAAFIGTFPITAAYFSRVSLVALVANLFVVPWVGLVAAAGVSLLSFAAVSQSIAVYYAAAAQFLTSVLLKFVTAAGGLPFASLHVNAFHVGWAIVFYIASFAIIMTPRGNMTKRLILIALFLATATVWMSLLFPGSITKQDGNLTVTFLDVGQGDAAFIRFADGKTMLVDAGPKTFTYDAGEKVVVPFLKREGISHLDVVVTTHPHSDHLGGIPAVLRSIPVGEVIDPGQVTNTKLYREYIHLIEEKHLRRSIIRAGERINVTPTARVYVLSPTNCFVSADSNASYSHLNNSSTVLKVMYGETSMVLSGDAERDPESQMVAAYGDFLRSNILKVGHHGSITSSSLPYVKAIFSHYNNSGQAQPKSEGDTRKGAEQKYAVVSVGKFNKFNHPSEEVLTRLRLLGAEVSRTDENGAVVFQSDGYTIKPIHWR